MLHAETTGASAAEAALRWPDRAALVVGARRATYRQLWDETQLYARALLALGIGHGSRVGLYLPNCWEYVPLFQAIAAAGAIAVAVNARFREHELAFATAKVELDALFTSSGGHRFDGRSTFDRAIPALPGREGRAPLCVDIAASASTGRWLSIDDLLDRAAAVDESELASRIHEVRPDADCLIMFSSGTTANPKACRLSHRALTISARGLAERFELVQTDVLWDPLPLFHMSTMLPLAACRLNGACFVGVEHYEPGGALAELEATRSTIAYPAFATITSALIGHPEFVHTDLSRIRVMLNVGPAELLRRFQRALPHSVQISCYGLTECGGLSFYNRLSEPLDVRLETVGTAIPGVEVRILGEDGVPAAPAGIAGEIQLRGSTLFSGYYGDPELTAAVMTADGWLRTGDLGTLDAEGRLSYAGRIKDMLRVGGENVAAAEIESFLSTHPAIRLVQVIGVPDDRLDEVAAAFVELEAGAAMSEEDVARHCAGRIAAYKIPRYVRFVTDWPMSATKIQKFRLREGFSPERKVDVSAMLRSAAAV